MYKYKIPLLKASSPHTSGFVWIERDRNQSVTPPPMFLTLNLLNLYFEPGHLIYRQRTDNLKTLLALPLSPPIGPSNLLHNPFLPVTLPSAPALTNMLWLVVYLFLYFVFVCVQADAFLIIYTVYIFLLYLTSPVSDKEERGGNRTYCCVMPCWYFCPGMK